MQQDIMYVKIIPTDVKGQYLTKIIFHTYHASKQSNLFQQIIQLIMPPWLNLFPMINKFKLISNDQLIQINSNNRFNSN